MAKTRPYVRMRRHLFTPRKRKGPGDEADGKFPSPAKTYLRSTKKTLELCKICL